MESNERDRSGDETIAKMLEEMAQEVRAGRVPMLMMAGKIILPDGLKTATLLHVDGGVAGGNLYVVGAMVQVDAQFLLEKIATVTKLSGPYRSEAARDLPDVQGVKINSNSGSLPS